MFNWNKEFLEVFGKVYLVSNPVNMINSLYGKKFFEDKGADTKETEET